MQQKRRDEEMIYCLECHLQNLRDFSHDMTVGLNTTALSDDDDDGDTAFFVCALFST